MAFQHREFQARLREAKRLRLYAQSAFSDKKVLSASLMEAKSKSRRLELEAREAVERATRAKVERDVARHEVAMARLEINVTSSARAQMESELAQVQRALAASKDALRKMECELDVAQQALAASGEACRMAEEEASRMKDEQVLILVELRASKDELSAFRVEVAKEKKAFEVEYDAGFEAIFNYEYGCCAFRHNICGSKPKIPDGILGTSEPLTLEFFVNPRCPPVGASVAPKAGVSEGVEHSSTAGAQVGNNPDYPSRVAGEREDPDASGESWGRHSVVSCSTRLLCPHFVSQHFYMV